MQTFAAVSPICRLSSCPYSTLTVLFPFAIPSVFMRISLVGTLALQASSSLGGGHGLSLSVRDLLSWAGFITSSVSCSSPSSPSYERGLRPWEAYVHGAALVLLDGMGLGAGLSPSSVFRLRQACVKVLKGQVRAKADCSVPGT